ncbi:MAG: hypothetical protein FJ191_11685 [Gammaproteobacteria bacterium]|nr:hypothetical protein [Gammaproteobacteria bacterium]
MRKVEHIEQQICELSGVEFAELREWMLAQDWRSWDEKIEADTRAGKFDKLIAEAQADFAAGHSQPI